MYKGLRVLSITPARGGSKGVKGKNIRKVGALSLTGRVAELVSGLDWIDYGVLSTDDPTIRDEGVNHGLECPEFRPAELSGDAVAAIDVWHYEWLQAEKRNNVQYDICIYVEPTCPLRRAEHIEKTVAALVENDWDTAWTVSAIDLRHHPYKKLKITDDGVLERYDPRGDKIIARQQLETLFETNGVCYAATRRAIVEDKSLSGERCGAVDLEDDGPFVSIDSERDIEMCEFFLQHAIKNGVMTH